MYFFLRRIRVALKAVLFHLFISILAAFVAAGLVFSVWYPHPYGILSGGRDLFLIIVVVDVVCGPLMTLVLFNPIKPRLELAIDMGLVALMQMSALLYGIHTAYEARPLFLVHEVDRFRVITAGDYGEVDVNASLAVLPESLRPRWFAGPTAVSVRPPRNENERTEVTLEAISGGRDYAQRPEFYIPYSSANLSAIRGRYRPLRIFIKKNPDVANEAHEILQRHRVSMEDAYFLPVIHRKEWIAVLDESANILGFLPGDGFSVGH